jgi:peptidyl-prolyl cis-trans isomerase SurA
MRKLFVLCLIIGVTLISQAKIFDKIAIVVNNRSVTLHQLKKEYEAQLPTLYQKYSGNELEEKIKQLKEGVIKEWTNRLMLLEKADEEGIAITDKMIDNMIDNIMKQNKFKTKEEFENVLISQTGMNLEEFRKVQKTTRTAEAVISRMVISKIHIDEAEIKAYYNEHIKEYQTPFTYSVQEVVFFKNEENGSDAKAKATECLNKLKSKEIDFNKAVLRYSESGSKDFNGELTNIKKGELNSLIEKKALSLKVGEISDIIELPGSLHIIKLLSKVDPKPLPFEEVKSKIERKLQEPQITTAIDKFYVELKRTYYVRVDVKPEDL